MWFNQNFLYRKGARMTKSKSRQPVFRNQTIQSMVAILCVTLLLPAVRPSEGLYGQTPEAQDQASAPAIPPAPAIPADQLDSLVSPIALYPDPLLSQTLVASTYPLEVIQLQQWLAQNKDLKDKALADAVQKQDWDPSIQAMAAFPSVVKQLSDNVKWTTDLGNAFLEQQTDVMDAVQRMRSKAAAAGNLKSTPEQTVETKVVESKQVVVIQPASPQIVYVPTYNPVVVFGPPVYPYPPIYYPPPGLYAAGLAISFGAGFAIGAAWGGGWGWGCGWGGGNVVINVHNTYINHYNIHGRTYGPGGGVWHHDPYHRGGVPYHDRSTAARFHGNGPGTSFAGRQQNARQYRDSGRPGSGPAVENRPIGRPQPGNNGERPAGRPQMGNNNGRFGGGDRIGNREIPRNAGGRNPGAFRGAGQMGGAGARMSSQRGAASMGGSRGGSRGRR
jgi:hypothetical protein